LIVVQVSALSKYRALVDELLKHTDPIYAGESPLISVSDMPLEVRIGTGLQRRQMGLPTQDFQNEVLGPFDAADLAGKARMLGELWPKWRHLFENGGAGAVDLTNKLR
jgi:hypothetical protein